MPHTIPLCKVSDLSPGQLKQFELEDGTPVCAANVGGRLLAIGGECTHAGGPLGEGELEGLCVVCPWHGATFDLETGVPRTPPAHDPVPSYPASIVGDDIVIEVD